MKVIALALIALVSVPAFAQTTTTTVSNQPQAAPPPPPSTTVTTQTQPQPPAPSTQVVVNPNDPNYVPPPRTQVNVNGEPTAVETVPSGRTAVAIVATDALYGGIAGGAIGGGVALIENGDHWQRDLMVGAGIGILAGAAFGIVEASTQPKTTVRAVADRNNAASSAGTELLVVSRRF